HDGIGTPVRRSQVAAGLLPVSVKPARFVAARRVNRCRSSRRGPNTPAGQATAEFYIRLDHSFPPALSQQRSYFPGRPTEPRDKALGHADIGSIRNASIPEIVTCPIPLRPRHRSCRLQPLAGRHVPLDATAPSRHGQALEIRASPRGAPEMPANVGPAARVVELGDDLLVGAPGAAGDRAERPHAPDELAVVLAARGEEEHSAGSVLLPGLVPHAVRVHPLAVGVRAPAGNVAAAAHVADHGGGRGERENAVRVGDAQCVGVHDADLFVLRQQQGVEARERCVDPGIVEFGEPGRPGGKGRGKNSAGRIPGCKSAKSHA
ncbi:MAG: hypothetical protein BJ554DRAFT_2180, partial [Olpidium bornovanus]